MITFGYDTKVDGLKLINNNVAIRLDDFFNDKIKTESGVTLYVDTTTRHPKYASTKGVISRVPDHLVCCNPKNSASLEWETEIEVMPGDEVWFQYDAVINAYKNGNLNYTEDGKLHILANYSLLYVAKRGDQIIPLNGYCLVEPIYADECPEGLIPPKYRSNVIYTYAHHPIPNLFKIVHLGKPNRKYQHQAYSDDVDVTEGDYVFTVPNSDIPLEYELYRSFSNKELYRIQRRLMALKLEIEK